MLLKLLKKNIGQIYKKTTTIIGPIHYLFNNIGVFRQYSVLVLIGSVSQLITERT